MIPTTEITEQTEIVKKEKGVTVFKNKAGEVFTDLKKSYKQANFTPMALRPADKSV